MSGPKRHPLAPCPSLRPNGDGDRRLRRGADIVPIENGLITLPSSRTPPVPPNSSSVFEHLFSPISLGPVTVKNRIMQLATSVAGLDDNGRLGPRNIAFFEERAKGGVGCIVTSGLAAFGSSAMVRLSAQDRDQIPGLTALANAIHAHDAVIIAQLYHGGRQHLSVGIPNLSAPSAIACPRSGGTPHGLDSDEVKAIIAGFVESARNVQEAGLDGVEIHGAQGHLVQQFMSPFSNQREDEYGGSHENRVRFPLEIIDGIREACGPDFVIGFRLGAEEFTEGGLALLEATQMAVTFAEPGRVDYLSVTQGSFNTIEDHTPDRLFPLAPFVFLATAIKEAVPSVPVVACSRILEPASAEQILAEGKADLIGLARPLIADSHWAAKAKSGAAAEIRRCISCNQCWGWGNVGQPFGCVHNPVAGRELDWGVGTLEPADKPTHVVVVGGGPAGMEVACTAAERGHTVTLLEARDRLGGALIEACAAPGHEEIGWVAEYLIGAVERAGVDVRLNTTAGFDAILAESPDVVVVATGSLPRLDDLGDTGSLPVYSYLDVIRDGVDTGRVSLLLDDDGYYPASAVAQVMSHNGTHVHIATRFFEIAREIPLTARISTLKEFDQLGVELHPTTWLSHVDEGNALLIHTLSGREWSIGEVDCIVRVGSPKPSDALFATLKGNVRDVHLIGDAYQPRRIANAIREGHQLGRQF